LKQVTEVPEWFKLMPLDGKLNAKEVETLFDFSEGNLTNICHRGLFPKADGYSTRQTKYGNNKILLWSKKLILQEIQRRKEKDATSRN